MFITLLHKIKTFLSGKIASIVFILLAIAGRIIQLVFFYNIRVDRSFQLMAMQNFVNGHGISLATASSDNLSAIIYEPLIKWPPGYSYLIAPFYLLFNKNYITASLTIDIVFGILLIVVSRKILNILNVPKYLTNLSTLFSGFFLYDFYVITSSDAITVTFFLLATYFTLLLLKDKKKSLKTGTAILFCLLMCGFLKYLFIPTIFVFPAFLFAFGYYNNQPFYKKAASVIFLLLIIGIGSLLIYQKYRAGSSVYISEPERGFFPANLSHFYPFLLASFIKPETIELIGSSQTDIVFKFFQIIHLLAFICIFIVFIRSFYRKKIKNISITTSFFYIAAVTSLCVSLVLIFLSLTVAKEETFPGVFWSYVEEPRYYGIIILFVQLSVFAGYRFWYRKKVTFYPFLFIMLLFSVEAIRGMYLDARRIKLFNKEEYSWQYEDRFQKYAAGILKNERKRFPTEKIVLTGSSYYINHRVSLYSNLPILPDAQRINQLSSIQAKEPVLLLVILNKKDLPDYKTFLSSGREVVGQFNDFYFYTAYVQPN